MRMESCDFDLYKKGKCLLDLSYCYSVASGVRGLIDIAQLCANAVMRSDDMITRMLNN